MADAVHASAAQFAPVIPTNRVTSLDVLRGVAILGILLMNIQSFAQPHYNSPLAYGDFRNANLAAWLFCRVFANLKFLSIFSMLFGAGVCLFTGKIEASGKSSAQLHYRRMAVLLTFGLMHGYLLWSGDILVHYGICGLLLYPFRKLAAKSLLLIGGMLIAVPVVGGIVYLKTMSPDEQQEFQSELNPTPTAITQTLASYRGSWLKQQPDRVSQTHEFETTVFAWEYFWREFGLMLVGVALFKLGVFTARLCKGVYLKMIAAAILVGIPFTLFAFYGNYKSAWHSQQVYIRGEALDYFSSLFIAFGYVGTIMLVCKSTKTILLQRPLQCVGRAAFSNYILQTVICSLLFYGEGFALYGRVSRVGQLGIVLLIWVVQIVLSNLWFRFYQMGPLESLWRLLTYWKIQSLRIPPVVARFTWRTA
jgi:uncharacterized protein